MENEIDLDDKANLFSSKCVTRSPVMREVLHMATVVAATDATVLLLGESGTGKDLLADIIHTMSRRSKQPCIKVNCAAIPESLFESELFGVERVHLPGPIKAAAGIWRRPTTERCSWMR